MLQKADILICYEHESDGDSYSSGQNPTTCPNVECLTTD